MRQVEAGLRVLELQQPHEEFVGDQQVAPEQRPRDVRGALQLTGHLLRNERREDEVVAAQLIQLRPQFDERGRRAVEEIRIAPAVAATNARRSTLRSGSRTLLPRSDADLDAVPPQPARQVARTLVVLHLAAA